MDPKISIIIPVYNAEKYLRECLNTLTAQSFTDFEVILINDGSQDQSGSICKEYVKKDRRFRYIQQANMGVSAARNTGLDASKGETVTFIDSDDWIPATALEMLYTEYKNKCADLVVADMIFVRNGQEKRIRIFNKTSVNDDKYWINQYQKSCIGYGYKINSGGTRETTGLGSMGNKLYRRDIIEKNHLRFDLFVMGIYEDNLFVLHYLEYCKRVSYIAEPVYYYRKVIGSNSRGYKENTLEINDRIFSRINSFIELKSDKDTFRKAFYMYVTRRLIHSLDVYFFAKDNEKSLHAELKELHDVIRKEPYKTAIMNVEYKLFKPYDMFMWTALRTFSARIIWCSLITGKEISNIYWLFGRIRK